MSRLHYRFLTNDIILSWISGMTTLNIYKRKLDMLCRRVWHISNMCVVAICVTNFNTGFKITYYAFEGIFWQPILIDWIELNDISSIFQSCNGGCKPKTNTFMNMQKKLHFCMKNIKAFSKIVSHITITWKSTAKQILENWMD